MAEFPKHPFLLSVDETARALGTDIDKGLTSAQVAELQTKYPLNELDVGGTVPGYKIFAKQLLNAMILVRCCYYSSPCYFVGRASETWSMPQCLG